jgi:hypothetical protein
MPHIAHIGAHWNMRKFATEIMFFHNFFLFLLHDIMQIMNIGMLKMQSRDEHNNKGINLMLRQ